ncbi:MAG TPA: spore germination protein GerW family protein [Longimicrobium sp.]|nr:spore germination protein GerW family protein [Longimicrobium sp.]
MDREAVIPVPRERTSAFVLKMADAVGAHASAAEAFAPAVTQDGTTVIPVALSMWGFGAGRGKKAQANAPVESGLGGGGGAIVRPVGYLVLRDGTVAYRPITSLPTLLAAGLAGAALAALVLRRRHVHGGRPAYEW